MYLILSIKAGVVVEKEVSVIIPVYNREDSIARCIESVQRQSLENIEIIVVDDGSTDETLSVVQGINDDRIVVISRENSGQGIARNAGIKIATGKYIAFVDSDDTIEKNMLYEMYKLGEETNSDIVQCNLYDIYPDGSKKIQLDIEDETVNISDKGKYVDLYFTSCRHSYEVCNKLIRKSVIDRSKVKFHDTRKIFSEDLLFNLEIINHIKRISFINKPFYNYYQNYNSHLHNNTEKRLDGICNLFHTFMESADEEMKEAVSYTAAMIIIYNIGFCTHTETAEKVLLSKEFENYLSEALKRSCKMKHKIFLYAMKKSPLIIKKKLAEKYTGRVRD